MAKRGGFPGGMPGNMNNMLKQAQKMQREMQKAQEELAGKEFEASVGGGGVTVRANGTKTILSVKINPDVIDPEEAEMLEDLVLTAVNQVLASVDAYANESMGKITGGGIPGLF